MFRMIYCIFLSSSTKTIMARYENLQGKCTIRVQGVKSTSYMSIVVDLTSGCVWLGFVVIYMDLLIHTGIQQSKSRRSGPVEWFSPGSGQPGSSVSDPG